jgi:SET domain-containing protein
MYLVPVEVKGSSINGKGVFAKSNIKKGSIAWQYTEGHDKKMTVKDFDNLDNATKKSLQRVAYLSPTTGLWVMPPDEDPACYTNHNPNSNNTTVQFDPKISDEPVFVANRDIKAGEEITNNYLEFDKNTKPKSFDWL